MGFRQLPTPKPASWKPAPADKRRRDSKPAAPTKPCDN
jgi:hypothetical protein